MKIKLSTKFHKKLLLKIIPLTVKIINVNLNIDAYMSKIVIIKTDKEKN